MAPKQFTMKLSTPRVRKEGVFKREDSPFWYVRFWVGEKLVRRSTRAVTRAGAKDCLNAFKAEEARRREKAKEGMEEPAVKQAEMF